LKSVDSLWKNKKI